MSDEPSKDKEKNQKSEQRIRNSPVKKDLQLSEIEAHSQATEKNQSELTGGQYYDKMDDKVISVSVRHLSNETVQLATDIRQFKQYGPAVFLLFSFLKKTMILFSVLAAMSLILIFYNFAVGQTFAIKASGVAIAFARASLGSFSAGSDGQERTKALYQIMISLNLIACFCFWLYWKSYMSSVSSVMEAQLQLSNYRAIILEGEGVQKATQSNVEEFIVQFGGVKEIVRVADKGQQVMIACQIYQLQHEIKNMLEKSDGSQKITSKIQNKYDSIEILKDQLAAQVSKHLQNKNLRYIAQMDTFISKKNIINKLKTRDSCENRQQQQRYMLNGLPVNAKNCQAQSWGFFWQNQHVGLKEQISPNVILFLLTNIVALSTILMFGLISSMAQPVNYDPHLPSNNYPQSNITHESNTTIVASWCIGNHYSAEIEATCSPYMSQLSSRGGIYFAIALFMVLSRYMMKFTILGYAKKLRFKDHAEQSHAITMHLFLNYTIVSVVIALSVQTNLFGTAMSDVLASFISIEPIHSRLKSLKQYYDYVPQWYADYGFQLVVNYIMIIVLPYSILPLIHFLSQKIKIFFSKSNVNEDIKKNAQQLQNFQLQDHYASCLSAIIVGMIFAGGMPIMFPLILAALIVRYFSIKYLFIYVNKPPKLTDRLIAKKTSTILLIVFFAYTINSVWALGVQQIFTSKTSIFENFGINSQSNAHNVLEALLVFIRRSINSWPILFVFFIGMILVTFRKKLSNTWFKILRMLRIRVESAGNMEMNSLEYNEDEHRQRSYDPLNHLYYRKVYEKLRVR